MVDVDGAVVEAAVTVFGGIATGLLYGIYRRLRGWVHRFEALEKRVDILDLNMKIFIRVMGELDSNFAKVWNRYAAVYKTTLIEEHGDGMLPTTPAGQASFEQHLQDALQGDKP